MAISKEKKKAVDQILAKMGKSFGPNALKIAGEHEEEMKIKRYKSPSIEFNNMLGGGLAMGKIVEFYGEPSCGNI